jgi:hypothetical protein
MRKGLRKAAPRHLKPSPDFNEGPHPRCFSERRVFVSSAQAADPDADPLGPISSVITQLGLLSPKGPGDKALPEAGARELKHERSGQIGDKRVHGCFQK